MLGVHQTKSLPAPSEVLLESDLCLLFLCSAAPWINPSDPGELIIKVCLGCHFLCPARNYTVLSESAGEVMVKKDNHLTPPVKWDPRLSLHLTSLHFGASENVFRKRNNLQFRVERAFFYSPLNTHMRTHLTHTYTCKCKCT